MGLSGALEVPCWGIFELELKGPASGNPFVECELSAAFHTMKHEMVQEGFYDGNGTYRIRFMPTELGHWRYVTRSNATELDRKSGEFQCVVPAPGVHGVVRVCNTFHFAYTDGTRYFPFGTTCYAWTHQAKRLQEQTLQTLRRMPFNKLRMCVFPKDYVYNREEPSIYPFVRKASEEFDYDRFDPDFFRLFELRVRELADIGVEADIILFHPYDRWGFSNMGPETDERYLRYVVARLAAHRNVWWALANEYDLIKSKTLMHWRRFFDILRTHDPYGHLRSIHQNKVPYDNSEPAISHLSLQLWDMERVRLLRDLFKKPVVVDECGYEGDIDEAWGNLTPEELVRRFWVGVTGGAYVGHGETYWNRQETLWWSKGGFLKGQAPPRIRFLRQVLEETPGGGLDPIEDGRVFWFGRSSSGPGYYLYYLETHQPRHFSFSLPDDYPYVVDVIDAWEMTTERIPGTFERSIEVNLPGKPYIAVRISRLDPVPRGLGGLV